MRLKAATRAFNVYTMTYNVWLFMELETNFARMTRAASDVPIQKTMELEACRL